MSNQYIDVPYTGERLSKLIVNMMPKCVATDKRILVSELKQNKTFDQAENVLARVTLIIEAAYDVDFVPTMTVSQAEALVSKSQTAMVASVAKHLKKRDEGKAPSGSSAPAKDTKKPKWAAVRADGKKCHMGTCIFDHVDTVPCWRNPELCIELHERVWNDEDMRKSIEADRAANAKRLGITAKPLTLMPKKEGGRKPSKVIAAALATSQAEASSELTFEQMMDLPPREGVGATINMCAGEESL